VDSDDKSALLVDMTSYITPSSLLLKLVVHPRACGFTSSELLDGAGLEQIGSDIVHLRLPRASPGVKGLRRFDDPSDRLSVTIGIRFHPHLPTVQSLLDAIQNTPGLSRKPLSSR
jgi:hypothetical protein